MFENSANEPTIKDIEDFLNDRQAVSLAAENDESSPDNQPNTETNASVENTETTKSDVTDTQIFARRLKEATTKVRNEERESIAKSLGYESYADMQSKREAELLKEKGLDPDDVTPVVEQLVEKRIADDPRLKELDALKQERMNAWAQKELAELNEFTDGKITKLSDVPEDVIELWKTKGSLKSAYIELHGEELIKEIRSGTMSAQNRSTTKHLQSPAGTPSPAFKEQRRPFTQQEKDIYKLFNPDVTEEQLSKMYKTN